MVNVKEVNERLSDLESQVFNMGIKFSEPKMIEILGKALRSEDRQKKLTQIRINVCIGFIVIALLQVFQILLLLLITFAE